MKKILIVILVILFNTNTKAQTLNMMSFPIYEVSSNELKGVFDYCIDMNCFQRDSGSVGVYLLNVLDTAGNVFTISECYFLQDDLLQIPSTLVLHFVIQYNKMLFLVSGRSKPTSGVRNTGEIINVNIKDINNNAYIDDSLFPCAIIVNYIDGKYYIRDY